MAYLWPIFCCRPYLNPKTPSAKNEIPQRADLRDRYLHKLCPVSPNSQSVADTPHHACPITGDKPLAADRMHTAFQPCPLGVHHVRRASTKMPTRGSENSTPTGIEMIEDFALEQIASRFCLQ